jgi:NAD(P)-dependent dehydrogenase (short-subunit alcohol dehydrogenase family)
MNFHDRHVVITGGTGALGAAVVGALIEAGAVCHVPYISVAEADRFSWRNHSKVKLVADIELTREAAVARLYDGVPQL